MNIPKRSTWALSCSAALLSLSLAACESLTETPQRQPLAAQLSGTSVRPDSVSTTGIGSFAAVLENLNGSASLVYELEFSGLTAAATSVHLHGPADADHTGELLVDLGALPGGSSGELQLGSTSGSGQGRLDLRSAMTSTISGDSLHVLLDAGMVYVDVHTSGRGGGEIRGQVRKQ